MHKDANDGVRPVGPPSDSDDSDSDGMPPEEPPRERAKPTTVTRKRSGIRIRTFGAKLAGLLFGMAILACCAGLVVADSLAPPPAASRHVQAPLVAVPAGSNVEICPGPARLLEGTPVGTDPQFSPESATAKSVVDAAVLSTSAGEVPGSRLAGLDGKTLAEVAKEPGDPLAQTGQPALQAGVVSHRDVAGVSVLRADAFDNQQASAGAVMSYTATDGDLRGSAAALCQQPANDLWLVGANTSLGRTAVLNLSNASTTPATVSLELFGQAGRIQAPGSRGLLVPPGTTRSIVLAGLAPGEEQLSVHVRSVGGPVTALIQQSVLRGLTPGGVDFIAPGTAPASRQVVSGVDIQDAAKIESMTSKPGFGDAGPSLQIVVPGPVDAVIEVKLYGRDGQKALPERGVVTAKAGAVTEVSLAGVPSGLYTVSATSDVTFAAAARVTRGLKPENASDLAWAPASARLGSQHVVPVPRSGERHLVFGAPEGRAKITYTAITADGKVSKANSADIAGGTTTTIEVPEEIDGTAVLGYVVSASGEAAYGAVRLEQEGREDISVVAVAPGAEGQEQVPVTLGY